MPPSHTERDTGATAAEAVLSWPGVTSGFVSLPTHDDETVTGAGQIGLAAAASPSAPGWTGGCSPT